MANFKRKKRHKFRYPTCPAGLHCRWDIDHDYARNTKERLPFKDRRKTQLDWPKSFNG